MVEIDDSIGTGLDDGGTRDGENGGRFHLDSSVGIELVKQLAATLYFWIGQLDTHFGRAGGLIEIRVDKRYFALEGFSWNGRGGDGDGLADFDPRQILFVGAEHEPHGREISDFKQLFAGRHVLTLIDALADDRAADGSENL